MAETTVLRSSASPRNVSAAAQGGNPHTQLSSSLPLVNVVMGGVSGKQPVVQDGRQPKQGVVVLPMRGQRSVGQQRQALTQPAAPELAAPLSSEGLLLCRHLVTKYIAGAPADDTNVALAKTTLDGIDAALAAATAAAAEPPMPSRQAAPRMVTVSTASRSQANIAAPPRRVVPQRGQRDPNAAPPPMVNVDMRSGTPQVEIDESAAIDVTSGMG